MGLGKTGLTIDDLNNRRRSPMGDAFFFRSCAFAPAYGAGIIKQTCRQEEVEMDMTKYAGSKFITVDDLRATGPRKEVIVSVEPGKYDKPVVTFDSGDKLGLNKTSVNALMKAYGKDSRNWIGKTIELYIGPTTFNDEERDSALARPLTPPKSSEVATPKPAPGYDMDDDIPF